ncbi:MAG: LysM peptidoglycan-binding domain-containing protein [Kiritimatiellae bacterium]|nr:LysM peptidoglycan-binding domain-containing protein [Kiritimatiellia bacterium]
MKRLLMNVTMGANLVAAFLFIQGCTTTGGTDGSATPAIEEQPPIEVQDISDPQPKAAPAAKQSARPAAPAKVDVQSIDIQSLTGTTPYTVKSGDTISAIAYRHGLRWQDVLAVNPGLQPNKLRVGQTIQLPGVVDVSSAKSVPSTVKSAPAQPKANATAAKTTAPKTTATKTAAVAYTGTTTTYVVKKGDALSTIAQKHGVKLAALRAANPKLKGDKIVVGQKLQIPTAAGKSAPAANAQGAKKDVKQVAITKSANTTPPATKKAEAKKTATANTPAAPASNDTVTTQSVQPAPEQPKEPAQVVTPPVPQPTQPPKETVPTPSNVQTYKVKEGEDVYAVAIRWGVSPSDLKALNGLTGNELTPGMELKLPAPQ